jgi:hypothetical protein
MQEVSNKWTYFNICWPQSALSVHSPVNGSSQVILFLRLLEPSESTLPSPWVCHINPVSHPQWFRSPPQSRGRPPRRLSRLDHPHHLPCPALLRIIVNNGSYIGLLQSHETVRLLLSSQHDLLPYLLWLVRTSIVVVMHVNSIPSRCPHGYPLWFEDHTSSLSPCPILVPAPFPFLGDSICYHRVGGSPPLPPFCWYTLPTR